MRFKLVRSFSVIGFSVLMLLIAFGLVGRSSPPIVQASSDRLPQATTRFAAISSGFDSGNCTSSAIPCRTIQFAVDKAASNDTILVAQGTYTQTNVRPRDDIVASGSVTQVVYISKTITIQGGYTTTDNFVSHLPLTQLTTIDAQNKGRGVYVANGGTGRLFDLRLTGGNANGMGGGANTSEDGGGGLYGYGGGLLLSGATIFSNTADAGGGVYLNNMTAVLATTSAIITNTATISGGGVFIKDSPSVVWTTSDFSANQATKVGGGIETENSALQLSASTINRNSASTRGGGIHLIFSDGAFVSGNTLMQNSLSIGNGGAVFVERSDATVASNTMISNTAGFGGAMFIFFSNGGTVSGNVMRGNSASSNGGGIVLQATTIKLINNVIVDNHLTTGTGKGSGIFVQQSAARLTHNTIARNTGGDNSGLSFSPLVPIPAVPLVMTNTIIVSQSVGITTTAGNTVTVRGVLFFGNGTNTTGAAPINVTNSHGGNPLFAADGYHIKPGSGAIDNSISAGVTTDIDGDARPQGAAPDLGADEFVPLPDVSITKIGPSLIISPSNSPLAVAYTIILTNVGGISLTNIVVTDTVPTGMIADSSVNQACSALPTGAKCTITTLAVGATKVFTITAKVIAPPVCGTLMVNQVVALPAEGDIYMADNTATTQATFFCPQPDVAILKIGPSLIISPSNAPSAVPYTIILTNVGSITLTNIVVTDTLPTGMQADSTMGQSCFALLAGAKCTISSLAIGATKVFTIYTSVNTPPACGTLMVNQVTALPSQGDANLADNTSTTQAIFSCPLALSAVGIGGPSNGLVGTTYVFTAAVVPINASQPITYVWRATNQAPVTHTGGGLSDLITFTWNISATQRITVTAKNQSSTVSDTHSIVVIDNYQIYLPLVLKNF